MEDPKQTPKEPQFEIKLATEQDIPYITDGIGALARMWDKIEIDRERTAQILKKTILLPGMRYGVYFMDGKYCAYGASIDYYDIVNESISSWVRDVYLNQEVRGVGLFNQVFFRYMNRTTAFSFPVIKSYVKRDNQKALSLYQSQGFHVYKIELFDVDILKNYGSPGFQEQEEKKKQLFEIVQDFKASLDSPLGITIERLLNGNKGMAQYEAYKDQLTGENLCPILRFDNQKVKDMRPGILQFINEGMNAQVFLLKLEGRVVGVLTYLNEICDFREGRAGWIMDFRLDEKLLQHLSQIVREFNYQIGLMFEELELINLRWPVESESEFKDSLMDAINKQKFTFSQYYLIQLVVKRS